MFGLVCKAMQDECTEPGEAADGTEGNAMLLWKAVGSVWCFGLQRVKAGAAAAGCFVERQPEWGGAW